MSKFKPLKWLIHTIVWIIRGTPLMLQLLIIFYGPGMIGWHVWSGNETGRITATVVAFTINYACYFPLFSEAESKVFPQDREKPERFWE